MGSLADVIRRVLIWFYGLFHWITWRSSEKFVYKGTSYLLWSPLCQISTCLRLNWLVLSTKVLCHCYHLWAIKPESIPSDMCAQRRLKLACASAQANQSLRCPHEENFASIASQNAPSEDSDQTGRMHRLILIFAERACPEVPFLTLWLTVIL